VVEVASPDSGLVDLRPDAVPEVAPVVDAGPDVAVDRGPDLPPGERPGCAVGTCKRVFLSSAAVANGGIGNLDAADGICQRLATAAGLGGSWRAWLSDANGSPATRFVRANLPYRLLDGRRVASSWLGLVSGSLDHPINVIETGRVASAGRPIEVWTGTLPGGTTSPATCGNWTNNSAGLPTGDVGLAASDGSSWTYAYTQYCDRLDVHLYCFEQ
jgi:hypothetical protein